jgi:hypothetical protein
MSVRNNQSLLRVMRDCLAEGGRMVQMALVGRRRFEREDFRVLTRHFCLLNVPPEVLHVCEKRNGSPSRATRHGDSVSAGRRGPARARGSAEGGVSGRSYSDRGFGHAGGRGRSQDASPERVEESVSRSWTVRRGARANVRALR